MATLNRMAGSMLDTGNSRMLDSALFTALSLKASSILDNIGLKAQFSILQAVVNFSVVGDLCLPTLYRSRVPVGQLVLGMLLESSTRFWLKTCS